MIVGWLLFVMIAVTVGAANTTAGVAGTGAGVGTGAASAAFGASITTFAGAAVVAVALSPSVTFAVTSYEPAAKGAESISIQFPADDVSSASLPNA